MAATRSAMEPLHNYCTSEGKAAGYMFANFATLRYHFMQERASDEVALLDKVIDHNISTRVFYSHGQIFRDATGKLEIANLGVGLTLIFD